MYIHTYRDTCLYTCLCTCIHTHFYIHVRVGFAQNRHTPATAVDDIVRDDALSSLVKPIFFGPFFWPLFFGPLFFWPGWMRGLP